MRKTIFDDEGQGFVLRSRKGVVRLFFAGLEYVEVINKTVSFHMEDGKIHEVTSAMVDFEEKLLSRPDFLKTHRSYLVNLNYVQVAGADSVVMKNGDNIPVSRQRRKEVQGAYINFLRQTIGETAFPTEAQASAPFGQRERDEGSWQVLLVDDNEADGAFWADILRSHGCGVRLAKNGEDAQKQAGSQPFDCVLLDVMIPGEDGFSICEKLRGQVRAPVIFLSCLTESDKQVEGFAAGGIDYITKDTSPELFWVKVKTRMELAASGHAQFCYGPLLLDLKARKALINEKELPLTSIEFDLLWRLSERMGHIFSPKEIYDIVWSGQPWDGGLTVQKNMSRLRRKLEKAWGGHRFIETVWGEGYRFVPTGQ